MAHITILGMLFICFSSQACTRPSLDQENMCKIMPRCEWTANGCRRAFRHIGFQIKRANYLSFQSFN